MRDSPWQMFVAMLLGAVALILVWQLVEALI